MAQGSRPTPSPLEGNDKPRPNTKEVVECRTEQSRQDSSQIPHHAHLRVIPTSPQSRGPATLPRSRRRGVLNRTLATVAAVLPVLAALVVVTATPALADSPRATNPANGHQYQFIDQPRTWTDAVAASSAMGGHLVTIASQQENEFAAALRTANTYTWIGATDRRSEGTWEWVTGEPFTFTNWNAGEPNNMGEEDFAHFEPWSPTGVWNDLRDQTMAFIVEWDDVVEAGPGVASISPTKGLLAGGTAVTVTGTSLTGATAVTFGTTPAARFTVDSDTTITAISPGSATAGPVHVTVDTPRGTSQTTNADQFTYTDTPDVAEPMAYVANRRSNTVSVINTATGAITATIPAGAGPHSVVVTPDATAAYVANIDASTVTAINTKTNTVAATIPVGSQPTSTTVTPDGKAVYVANLNSSSVSVISAETNTVTAEVAVARCPYIVATSPDGTTVWVASWTETVSVIDTRTKAVTATIPVSGLPNSVAFTPDSKSVYVTSASDSKVTTVDTASKTVTAVFQAGNRPTSTTFTQDGKTAYITNIWSNDVSVIDTATNTVTATIRVGTWPNWSALTADGSTLLVANSESNNVSVIDTATNTLAMTIPVGRCPWAIAMIEATQPPPPAAPAVTEVSPASGPATGGTTVKINGSAFTGATAVAFGTTPATRFTVDSDTTITATSPRATTAGPVHVTVTTPVGTSQTTNADQFAYAQFQFVGFLRPVVNPPEVNRIDAGRSVPMKFGIGGDFGLDILASGYPVSQRIDCTTGELLGQPEAATNPGASGLSFDPQSGTYTFVWQIRKEWVDTTCRVFTLRLTDGTDHTAIFQLRRNDKGNESRQYTS